MEREPHPGGGRAWLALLLFVLLVAGYLGALRASIEVTEVHSDRDAATRDQVYLVLHGGLLFIAAVSGFAAGRWINGLGLAWATLLVIALAVAMVAVQVASFELACSAGQNGLVRHWHC